MIIPNNILREFRVTEKAANLAANLNQYTFEIDPRANRTEVARAVEEVFNVTVTNVNILIKKPKVKIDRARRGRHAEFRFSGHSLRACICGPRGRTSPWLNWSPEPLAPDCSLWS